MWKRDSPFSTLFHNGTLSNSDGEDPVDYPALRDSPMELCVVATDAETGAPVCFDKSDMAQDDYDILKASSALPLACRPYPVHGRECFDGALGATTRAWSLPSGLRGGACS